MLESTVKSDFEVPPPERRGEGHFRCYLAWWSSRWAALGLEYPHVASKLLLWTLFGI